MDKATKNMKKYVSGKERERMEAGGPSETGWYLHPDGSYHRKPHKDDTPVDKARRLLNR